MFIPTKDNISTVTDMRVNAVGLLKDVQKKGMKYIFQRSKPLAVMVNMKLFKKLLELMEDWEDRELVKLVEKEPKRRQGWHSLEEVAAEYGVKL